MVSRNIYGGGAQTNINGLGFEIETDLLGVIDKIDGIDVLKKTCELVHSGKTFGRVLEKHGFYSQFLTPRQVHWKSIISKKLLPDKVLIHYLKKTVYIIEVKYQKVAGSVDEKLQTCDFKKKQYQKLVDGLGYDIEFFYLLNDFFQDKKYADVFAYMESVGVEHFFNEIPTDKLGLDEATLTKVAASSTLPLVP